MITLRKFLSLSNPKRKLIRILGDAEICFGRGNGAEFLNHLRFFHDLSNSIARGAAGELGAYVDALAQIDSCVAPERTIFFINELRHRLMDDVGLVAADWDRFRSPEDFKLSDGNQALNLNDPPMLPVLEAGEKGLFLDDIRAAFNVGAIFRSAAFFGIRYVILTPSTPAPGLPRVDRTSMGAVSIIKWGRLDSGHVISSLESQPEHFFVLETGGVDIVQANLPNRGWLVLGNEELGVHPDILAFADRSNCRLSINGNGPKASLNVSVACGIALSHWMGA